MNRFRIFDGGIRAGTNVLWLFKAQNTTVTLLKIRAMPALYSKTYICKNRYYVFFSAEPSFPAALLSGASHGMPVPCTEMRSSNGVKSYAGETRRRRPRSSRGERT